MFPYIMKKEPKGAAAKIVTDKKKQIFYCTFCDHSVSKQSNYKRHLKTVKHLKNTQQNMCIKKKEPKRSQTENIVCECGRIFKTRSGLWKHKKKCTHGVLQNVSKMFPNVSKMFPNVSKMETKKGANDDFDDMEEQLNQLRLQKAKLEVQKLEKEIHDMDNKKLKNELTQELVETIGKIAGNNNCNNTNNISINMYLNQNCKDAISLTDFVENIKISLQDLDYTKENGFVKGITNVFLNQLKDMSPTERPIHCSDTKRLKFYVKDENNWVADSSDAKIEKTIKNIQSEHIKKLNEWEKLHPNFEEDPELLAEWQSTLENISGGTKKEQVKNQSKIKKEISKLVDITKEWKN